MPEYCAGCGREKAEGAAACPDCQAREWDEIAAFVGPNATFYIRKWQKPQFTNPKRAAVSLNWAAIFAGIWWLGYRKMYSIVFTLAGAMLATSLLALTPIGHRESALSFIPFFIAMMGNWFYLQHVRSKLSRLRKKSPEGRIDPEVLKKAGGVSWAGVAVATALIVANICVVAGIELAKTSSNSGPAEVVFCERVDEEINAIGPDTVFHPGDITVRLFRNLPFRVNQICFSVSQIEEDEELLVDSNSFEVKPGDNLIAFRIRIDEPGMYRIEISGPDWRPLGSGTLKIAPPTKD